jgi:hypothetical protein
MEIIVNEKSSLSQVKKDFHNRFPYLKVEFFKQTQPNDDTSFLEQIINHELEIVDLKAKMPSDGIIISGMTTVKELEQKFNDVFGLNIQVFRKSGTVWIQTTVTDSWTLTEQNSRAFEYANKKAQPKDNK